MGIDIAAERQKQRKSAEEQQKREEIAEKKRIIPAVIPKKPAIDCHACKAIGSMYSTKTPRFGGFIRFIGGLIAIPSVVGFFFSVLWFCSILFFNSYRHQETLSEAARAGTAIAGTIGYGMAIVAAGASLIGGLVGYLLLTKRKVFLCKNCGYILERA